MRLSPFSPILRAKPRAHAGTGHDALEVTRYISYGIAGADPVLRRREGGDDRADVRVGVKNGSVDASRSLPLHPYKQTSLSMGAVPRPDSLTRSEQHHEA